MAKPRDTIYSATRIIDVARLMGADEKIMMATLMAALQEQMTEVATKMQRDGARPNPNSTPELVLTFQSKGGTHHVRKNSESDGTAADR